VRVCLRPTAPADLDFVLALERQPENAGLVGQWTRDEHAAAIERADREHWIVERIGGGERVGFILAFDLSERGLGAYVKRIVVGEKSRGLGREALAAFLRHAARDLGASCAWLVVAHDNARAIRAYSALGFREASPSERERREHAEAVGGFSERMRVMRHPLGAGGADA
jgi:RimJ/RimL family protein N-acetyltransferase